MDGWTSSYPRHRFFGIPFIPLLWHSLDIQHWQVLIGEVEKLGPLSPVAPLLSVYLAHPGSPLLHRSTVFIREPKDLWFRGDECAAKEVPGIPGIGAETFGHRMWCVTWGRRVRAGGSLRIIMA